MDAGECECRVDSKNGHSSVAMPDGSIVLMGGFNGTSEFNDVWRFNPVTSSVQNPSHTYTLPGIYKVALQAYNAGGYNSTRKTGYITVTNVTSKIGIFRSTSGIWSIDSNGNNTWELSDVEPEWGLPNDTPVIGDWNGDGKSDIGIFRSTSGIWSIDSNGNNTWEPSDVSLTGDYPMTHRSLATGMAMENPTLGYSAQPRESGAWTRTGTLHGNPLM